MPFLPRSPRWLVSRGLHDEASGVLADLRGEKIGKQEYDEIVADFEASKKVGEPMWSELFSGRIGRLLLIGSALQLLQQLVGMNAFMYFGPRIFRGMGLQENMFQTICNGVNFVCTFPALYLVELSGRKKLLTSGALLMALTSIAMGFVGAFGTEKHEQNIESKSTVAAVIMVTMVFTFVAAFACTWGPMVWVYCCEIYPLKYRARCVGMTTCVNWVGNFVIAQFSPMLLDCIGFGTFIVFAVFAFIALKLAMWLPETKGLMLEHISELFDEKFGTAECHKKSDDYRKGPGAYGSVDVIQSKHENFSN